MLAKKILKNLQNGNYRIAYHERCDCGFYWYVKDGELVCDTVKNNGCYYGNELVMYDLAGEFDEVIGIGSNGIIATYDNYYGVDLLISCSDLDIAKQIRCYIINDPEIFRDFIASINYPDKRNELHEKRRDKALLEFVGWRKDNN